MSKDSYPQAHSYVCLICGHLTASRSRWHVENKVCSDGECAEKQRRAAASKDGDRPKQ